MKTARASLQILFPSREVPAELFFSGAAERRVAGGIRAVEETRSTTLRLSNGQPDLPGT